MLSAKKMRITIDYTSLKKGAIGSATRLSLVAVGVSLVFGVSHAQESVNKDLDNCVRQEQTRSAVKGAVAGALLGFLKSAVDDSKSRDTGKDVLVGAAVGGAAGFATAYFTAVSKCYKKNPSWVPETRLTRGANYEQVKAAVGYDSSMGVVAKSFSLSAPSTVQPGAVLPLESRFVALSPDGAEVDVVIERRLFAVFEGKETPVPFPGVDREQRKVEAGEQADSSKISLPSNMPVGTALRYEFSVAATGKPASVVTAETLVR